MINTSSFLFLILHIDEISNSVFLFSFFFFLCKWIVHLYCWVFFSFLFHLPHADKKVSGKSKDEQMAEKKQELEKRLQDVTGQLGNVKKTAKKGRYIGQQHSRSNYQRHFYQIFNSIPGSLQANAPSTCLFYLFFFFFCLLPNRTFSISQHDRECQRSFELINVIANTRDG